MRTIEIPEGLAGFGEAVEAMLKDLQKFQSEAAKDGAPVDFAALSEALEKNSAALSSGAGRLRGMYLETVDCATEKPSFRSSPCTRGAPQVGLAVAISTMSARMPAVLATYSVPRVNRLRSLMGDVIRFVAGLVADLFRSEAQLAAENALLRQQLIGARALTVLEDLCLAGGSRCPLGWGSFAASSGMPVAGRPGASGRAVSR